MKAHLHARLKRQYGAATLVVVMMLFLVMALLAAYANRGILFEQRIANSYYRASMAQEMSEAALEWTVTMLNGTAVDGSCKPVSTGGQRFVDRYLKISAEDRGIKQNSESTSIAADCTRTTTGWICRCPALEARVAPAAIASAELAPSFGIQISVENRSGTVMVSGFGCTSSVVDDCNDASNNANRYQAVSRQDAHIALVSAVRSPPAAPLVATGDVTATGADGLGLHNTSPGSAGMLVTAGGVLTGLQETRMQSVPGTAAVAAQIERDGHLTAAGADVFRMFMGAKAERYRQHPSLRVVTCGGDCATALEDAYKAGVRIMWVEGPMTISSNKVLGSPTDPIVVVADGAVTLNGPFQFSGMLVSRGNLDWTNTSGVTSLVNGIVLADGDVTTNGLMDIYYQTQVVDQLRNRVGSFVRVPGGWTDSNR
ncbi:hypothetical protein [Roseateles asaccharophilus]|uniref:Tfp pilus assembly protein PilX n=1 Tax=Roseateles asaccharophilus TaxID=582607 RepID=A0ABU2A5P4_9BURK|nr:hypothetical protein [Roseateles asaccharophilus]MDR7332526.1 Tfp pilus assembly protein PilX [Roseateles asaccharophilus]